MEFNHVSVLLKETIDGLKIRQNGIYVDGTLGGGGHSLAIAEQLGEGLLLGFDQDIHAIDAAKERLKAYSDKLRIVHCNFEHIARRLEEFGIDRIDGLVLDLGVSSAQLDMGERGFSYRQDAPLDMRMDSRQEFSAYELVNTYSEEELRRVIADYGEENWAAKIAKVIVERRREKPIETTLQLVEIIRAAVPKKFRDETIHPAKRTFQAIRIEVNRELEILEETIRSVFAKLSPKGRICVITFHSLEDRIIKNVYRELSSGCTCPKEFPVCVCGKKPLAKVITKKPIVASREELESNPRARSAKLRILEKL